MNEGCLGERRGDEVTEEESSGEERTSCWGSGWAYNQLQLSTLKAKYHSASTRAAVFYAAEPNRCWRDARLMAPARGFELLALGSEGSNEPSS